MFQTEIIQPQAAIPYSPHIGDELMRPSEISDRMLNYTRTTSNQEIISLLLAEAGVKVEWQVADDGTVTSNLPDDAQELLNGRIEYYQQRAREVYNYANEVLPEYKAELVRGLVHYGQRLGIEDTNLEDFFSNRIAEVHEVRIMAPLAKGSTFEHIIRVPSNLGFMEKKRGELTVDVESLYDVEADTGVDRAIILKKIILHELEHAVSVLSLSESGNWMVQTGLGAYPSREDDEGTRDWTGNLLLEEGAQEHIRWKELDKEPPEYPEGVMLWEMLIGLDPEIEKLRYEAKFLNRNRGKLIGHIENLLGPTAVENLEAYCKTDGNQRLVNYPALKDEIVSMIRVYDEDASKVEDKTEKAQKRARKILDETQLAIYNHCGWDFSDEELVAVRQIAGNVAAEYIAPVLSVLRGCREEGTPVH